MPFEYVDHTADVGLRGIGETVEGAFAEAARGMTNLMVDVDAVRPTERLDVRRRAGELDLLLVEWLAALLAEKDVTGRFFSRFQLLIARDPDGCRLDGEAWGERLDPLRHVPKLEVKGISYAGLRVAQDGRRWVAQCVVDV